MKKNILGLIPARFQSQRLPGKPLREIAGKTLLKRTYENAKNMGLFDNLIILTDDEKILEHARDFGAPCFMTPKECETGMERLSVAAAQYPHLVEGASLVVHIQCDEPNVKASSIEALIHAHSPTCPITTLCTEIALEEAQDPSNVKCVFDKNKKALYFSRSVIPMSREGAKIPYYKHIGIYAYNPDFLSLYATLPKTPCEQAEYLEHLKILEHGLDIQLAVVNDHPIGVDTENDLKKLEESLCPLNIFS